MLALRKLTSLTLTAALVTAAPAAAQCFIPDNLDGPCWEPTDVNLPDLPAWELEAGGMCYQQCGVVSKDPALLLWDTPIANNCGQFTSDVKVIDAVSGVTLMAGKAQMDYTRTWQEANTVPPFGTEYQVWRFAVKIDLEVQPLPASPCYVPPCMAPGAYAESFWYGYVDWAQDCATGQFTNASVLFHNCDDFIHHPGLSDHPALGVGFHPGQYYAIVAPDNAAQPFDPTALAPARSGALTAEAVRNVNNLLVPGACTKEERITNGVHQVLGAACLCPLSLNSNAQAAVHFDGFGSCPDATGIPSNFTSLQVWNPSLGLRWYELIETSIGSWTSPTVYPGREAPILAEGFFFYHDSCAAGVAGVAADTLDMMYGAKTVDGFQVLPSPIGGANTQNFLDMASNYSSPGVFLPLLGSTKPSDHLIYVNM